MIGLQASWSVWEKASVFLGILADPKTKLRTCISGEKEVDPESFQKVRGGHVSFGIEGSCKGVHGSDDNLREVDPQITHNL